MRNNIWEKHNYLNKDIKFIKNSIIREYDMQNAGLSILKHNELISEDDYNSIMKLEKHKRNVIVGKFLKDNSDISKALMEGFTEARKIFFEMNNIEDYEVLSIKKDAIFLINKTPSVTQINEDYLFRKKNEYNSYLNIRNKEFYYSELEKELTIKGLSEDILLSQKDYLLKFIQECLELISLNKRDDLFVKLLEFKNDFIEKKLDVNYYRDIDSNNFVFESQGILLDLNELKNINIENCKYLSITNNLKFVMELIVNILL